MAAEETPDYPHFDYKPKLNNRGMATWIRDNLETGENAVFMFNGFQEMRLSRWGAASDPQINENGWVVWEQAVQGDSEYYAPDEPYDWEIYLYDGHETRRLTNNEWEDNVPQLNNNGWVTWMGWGPGLWGAIFLFDGEETKMLADSPYGCDDPRINDSGWVTWGQRDSNDKEMFLYDGEEIVQLSNNEYLDSQPRISDRGWVVWSGESASGRHIYLYDGTNTIQVTNGPTEDVFPQINKSGSVTWTRLPSVGVWAASIFMYDGQSTKELGSGMESEINDRGWVVWPAWDGHDNEIFLYDGSETVQLTDNDFHDDKPQINNINWDPQGYLSATASSVTRTSLLGIQASAADAGKADDAKPTAYVTAPFVSTRISKTNTFKVQWGARDPEAMTWQAKRGQKSPLAFAGASGIKSYTVRYRPSTSRKWRTWKKDVKTTQAYFTGKAGVTYYFRVRAEDNAGNYGWSKVRKTTIPFNEGMSLIRKVGFNGYFKNSNSPFFLSSVRYSYTLGNTLVYKLYNNNGIGLVTTKGPNRGRAKIYVDGKYVKTVDAHKSSLRPRQLVFYRGFKKKGTHWLKIVNLGTPGRARFDVDGIVVAR